MKEVRYMISDAAKKINVEPHVLRYWEEELGTEIPRNEMGHRYYREEDIQMMRGVKYLKEKGFQLKSIKILLPEVDKTMQLPQRRLLELRDRLEIAVSREELRLQREEELKKIAGQGGDGAGGAAAADAGENAEDGGAVEAGGMPDGSDCQKGREKGGTKKLASGTQADRLISSMADGNAEKMEKTGNFSAPGKKAKGWKGARKEDIAQQASPQGQVFSDRAGQQVFFKGQASLDGAMQQASPQGQASSDGAAQEVSQQGQTFPDAAIQVEEVPKSQFVSSMAVPWKSERQERYIVPRKNEIQEREAGAAPVPVTDHAERMRQFRGIMSEIMVDAMRENNRELAESITASVSKELEYHMRKREMQQEEHFKQLDRTLREYQMGQKQAAVAKECGSRRESKFFKKNGKVRI